MRYLTLVIWVLVMGLASLSHGALDAGQPAAKGPPLRLKPVVITDTKFQMEALRALAPEGWTVQGEVFWRWHPILPATVSLSAFNPKAPQAIYFYPHYPFADGVREMLGKRVAVLGPDAVARIQQQYPEGSLYFGNEVRRLASQPIEYLTRILLPRQRPDIKDYHVVETQPLPAWAAASVMLATVGKDFPSRAHAARVRLEYHQGGRVLHEDFFLLITEVRIGEVTYWGPEMTSSAVAEKGKLEPVVRIHSSVLHSSRLNLAWFNRFQQVAQLIQDGIRRHQRMIGQLSEYLRRTSAEISKSTQEAYEARQQSQDRMREKFSEYIRGVDSYIDPHKNYPVELPSGYDHVWANAFGEYLLTNDSFYNPNQTLPGTWNYLKRKQ